MNKTKHSSVALRGSRRNVSLEGRSPEDADRGVRAEVAACKRRVARAYKALEKAVDDGDRIRKRFRVAYRKWAERTREYETAKAATGANEKAEPPLAARQDTE